MLIQHQIVRTTNGEIGPVVNKNNEIWFSLIFVVKIFREKSTLYTYQPFIVNN